MAHQTQSALGIGVDVAGDCQDDGNRARSRDWKAVYLGAIEVTREWIKNPLRQVFEVTVLTIDCQGQELLFPKIEVETYETSLMDAPEPIVELYHDHETSEQFNSEIERDIDFERLPSGKFSMNAMVLLLGMVAYNILRLCGQESLWERMAGN